MPITVQHDIPFDVLGQGAISAGEAEKAQRAQTRADALRVQAAQEEQQRRTLKNAMDQFEQTLQFNEEQNALNRMNVLQREQLQQQGVVDRAAIQFGGSGFESQVRAQDQALAGIMKSGQYEYSPRQQRRLQELNNAISDQIASRSSPKLKNSLLSPMIAERGNIIRSPGPRTTRTIQEEFTQNTLQIPEYPGSIFVRQPDGTYDVYKLNTENPDEINFDKKLDWVNTNLAKFVSEDEHGNVTFNEKAFIKSWQIVNDTVFSGKIPLSQQLLNAGYTGNLGITKAPQQRVGVPQTPTSSPAPAPTPTPTSSPAPTPTPKTVKKASSLENMKDGELVKTANGKTVKKENGKYYVLKLNGEWVEFNG